ncbi:aldo/keto reductase [Candidatus Puniceispirillum marinum]|nr:aldo/keto reductase [Candidatus Puniceispirillum marinum]
MKQRRLGKNGTMVSAIGIGAMSFSNFYGETNESESHRLMSTALDQGVTHIDTANVYGGGVSETVIGTFLAKQGARRNDLFSIASKVGIAKDPETGKRYFDNSPAYLIAELDKTLARLQLDSIDLYYIHRRDAQTSIEDVTETLVELVKSGKIKSFGFSEIAPASLRRADAIHHVAAVQSEYSLSVRSPEMGLVQTTKELGTALVAFSPVGRSLLTDNPLTLDAISGMEWLRQNPRFIEPNYSANIKAGINFRNLAADMGLSAAGLAIAWLIHKGEHIIPIPGTRSVAHFLELCEGANVSLSDTDMRIIEDTLPIGWAHGDRYSTQQWVGPEIYC